MTFETQRAQALALLEQTGIWRSNYEPPYLRLLWSLGFKLPPPHFAPFLKTAFYTGFWFAVAWGTGMWLVLWSKDGKSALAAAITACLGGAFFGLTMAMYYAYGRRKYKLPEWASLTKGSSMQ